MTDALDRNPPTKDAKSSSKSAGIFLAPPALCLVGVGGSSRPGPWSTGIHGNTPYRDKFHGRIRGCHSEGEKGMDIEERRQAEETAFYLAWDNAPSTSEER